MAGTAKGIAVYIGGVEVVSPVLTGDMEENSKQIKKVCSRLTNLGQHVSERCGGHIHIGSDYLTTVESWTNLIEIWGNTEEILYTISNKAGEIPREGLEEFASPISGNFEELLNSGTVNLQDENDLKEFAKSSQTSRYYGINFTNLGNERNTIEFRLSNGTLDPKTWIENINLFGGIIRASEDLAMIQLKAEEGRTDDEKKLLDNFNKLKDSKLSNEEKLEAMLSIVISEEDKDVYRTRYKENSRLIEQNPRVKEALKRKSAKSSVDVKKVAKKIFMGSDRVTGPMYNSVKHDIENKLQISNYNVKENNINITRD